jgi:heme oxygenase
MDTNNIGAAPTQKQSARTVGEARATLRAGTATQHARLDSHALMGELLSPVPTESGLKGVWLATYAAHRQTLARFDLSRSAALAGLIDQRHLLGALEDDLKTLGASGLPILPSNGEIHHSAPSFAELLGATYVIAGSAIGAHGIQRRLSSSPTAVVKSLRYFELLAGYRTQFAALLPMLEETLDAKEPLDEALRGANEVFAIFVAAMDAEYSGSKHVAESRIGTCPVHRLQRSHEVRA